MELHLEPIFVKKDTKLKKRHTPWNKGVKGWMSDEHLQVAKKNLKKGNPARWAKHRGKPAYNAIPVCAYDLEGNYIKCYSSASAAAKDLQLKESSIKNCRSGKRGKLYEYMFRKAEIIEFNGKKLISKKPIAPYKVGKSK